MKVNNCLEERGFSGDESSLDVVFSNMKEETGENFAEDMENENDFEDDEFVDNASEEKVIEDEEFNMLLDKFVNEYDPYYTDADDKCFLSPRALAEEVKKYVKGQDEVIDSVAVPFFQHMESMRKKQTCSVKTSFIIAGKTGTGKSEILRRFAEICGVPIIRINVSDCNPTSWKGMHISDYIGIHINSYLDVEEFKYAVLIFNEFDKITHFDTLRVASSGSDWDLDMQRDFLKFYDKGYELVIEKPTGERYQIPTDNMLLCYDGAFSGIEKIIKKRLNLQSKIGFGMASSQNDFDYMSELKMEDLEKWGYQPELLGRIGSCYVMNPMTKELVYEIISSASDNILDAHIQQCKQLGLDIEFCDDVLWYIAEETLKSRFGFRSVKTILSDMMKKIYFDCDKYRGKKLKINMEFIKSQKATLQRVKE